MRILHISDLHMHAQGDFGQELVLSQLVEDVSEQTTDGPGFDTLVVSGDLTHSGHDEEFTRVSDLLLDPLAEVTGLSRSQMVLAPGNHDIDRSFVSQYLTGLRPSPTSRCPR